MRILVLGGTGMLGFQILNSCLNRGMDVHAIVRNKEAIIKRIGKSVEENLHVIDDIKLTDKLDSLLGGINPDYVINCVGIVKQSHLSQEYVEAITINSLLPHQLQLIGQKYGFRLIHISTDCVFDGKNGGYKESDLPNASDLYGRSKLLGEVGYGCGITIRTSIIGHEISDSTHGLLEWLLAQTDTVKGYRKAIFSGLTTLELTKIILDLIIPSNLASGLYQISSEPISKYDLLSMMAEIYDKHIEIVPSDDLVIDRSLDGSRFKEITKYVAPAWWNQIIDMKNNFNQS
jgi:dTDP-4-dehydrorhamnose reductase